MGSILSTPIKEANRQPNKFKKILVFNTMVYSNYWKTASVINEILIEILRSDLLLSKMHNLGPISKKSSVSSQTAACDYNLPNILPTSKFTQTFSQLTKTYLVKKSILISYKWPSLT